MRPKTLIVGAGLTGLLLGDRLSEVRDVIVFDKARGVGGRLATRRTEHAKFDHGAQFYRLKEPLVELHKRWAERGLVEHWFDEKGEQHFNANGGMTALAKDLSQNLRVELNERLKTVKKEDAGWVATFESGRNEVADELILTCPAPQSLDVLRGSGLAFPSKLNEVVYTKALVVLIENSPTPFRLPPHGYTEPKSSFFFSIADQFAKRVSTVNALTVTLAAGPSDSLFDADEAEVISQVIAELEKLSPGFKPGAAQLKKWRYCQVQKTFGEMFCEVESGLFLGGDGFGGGSLNGAARSATALSNLIRGR